MKLTEINIYPVKSLARIQVSEATLTSRGLKYDRRWMIVDQDGKFITQRRAPLMATIQPHITEKELTLSHPSAGSVSISLTPQNSQDIQVEIFGDPCMASHSPSEVDQWLTQVLGMTCSLVYMPDHSQRIVKEKYHVPGKIVSFADGFPYLIIGEASLKDLNSRLDTPVPMTRFRPNFVFSGDTPYEEDHWSKVSIGEVTLQAVVPWGRCVVTTVNQQTGIKKSGEPLKTLSTYRKKGDKVIFGMTLVGPSEGKICIEDEIKAE